MIKKYIITLTDAERELLQALISKGKGAARRLIHARILLKADQGLPDQTIADEVAVSRPTIERVRRRFVEEGLEAALDPRRPEKPRPHKIDGAIEARLIALACSTPPSGRDRWTLRLLADKIVELECLDAVSHETVRRSLKKTSLLPGASRNGSSPPRKTPSSSTTWKMSSTSTPAPSTRSAPSSTWMSSPSN